MTTMADYFGNAGLIASSDILAKSSGHGEGSRGGHIIGHTRSGKPIYEVASSHYKTGKAKKASLVDGRLLRQTYPDFTEDDHDDASRAHRKLAIGHRESGELAEESRRADLAAMHNTIARHNNQAADHHFAAIASIRRDSRLAGNPSDKVIGVTPGGHPIHAATSEHYTGIGFARSKGKGSVGGAYAYRQAKDKKSNALMAERFGHFKLGDHEAASQMHLRHAQRLRYQGKDRAADKANDAGFMHNHVAHFMRYPK